MFSGIVFPLEINSEKKEKKRKPILSNWAEPEGPTQSPSARRRPGRGPRGAHLGPHRVPRRRRLPGQACPVPAPHIKGGQTPCCELPPPYPAPLLRRPSAPPPAAQAAPPPASRPTELARRRLTAKSGRLRRPPPEVSPPSCSSRSPLPIPHRNRAPRTPGRRRRQPPLRRHPLFVPGQRRKKRWPVCS
jgi:hypothetical protein